MALDEALARTRRLNARLSPTQSSTLAIDDDGRLWAWGSGSRGNLGQGDESPRSVPTRVDFDTADRRIVATAAGAGFSFAVDDEGRLWSWGAGDDSRLGNGRSRSTTRPGVVTVNKASHPFVAVAAGKSCGYALDAGGRVWVWGTGLMGDLGRGRDRDLAKTPCPIDQRDLVRPVVAIATGFGIAHCIDDEGGLWSWGLGRYLGTREWKAGRTRPAGVSIVDMSEPVVQVASTMYHTLALDGEGRMWEWGERIGIGGNDRHKEAVREPVPIDASAIGGPVTAIAHGDDFCMALDEQGREWYWGEGPDIGDNRATQNKVPTPIPMDPGERTEPVVWIGASGSHTLSLDAAGTLWARGEFGPLGDAAGTTRSYKPVRVHGNEIGPIR